MKSDFKLCISGALCPGWWHRPVERQSKTGDRTEKVGCNKISTTTKLLLAAGLKGASYDSTAVPAPRTLKPAQTLYAEASSFNHGEFLYEQATCYGNDALLAGL